MIYLFLIFNIILMSIGQLFFKQAAIFVNGHEKLNLVTRYLYNPSFYAAIFFFAVATFTWVQILTKMKISIAYPILSVSYILTALGAYYFFGEKLSPTNIAGIFVIMLGVSLISIK
jgi:multidrug transporter EmrE-like cation transporter